MDILNYINLFSGSVNGGNSAELAKKEDIDGFLVGGASLKVRGFFKFIRPKQADHLLIKQLKLSLILTSCSY